MVAKNIMILFIGFLIFISDIKGQSKFDFSGVNQFWKLYDELTNDEMPDSSEWTILFETPGYSALIKTEFSREYFIKYYSYAFMPSKQKQCEDELEKKNFRISYLKHLIKIKGKREFLKKYQKQLENDSTIIPDALKLTNEYIPLNFQNNQESPQISFAFFGYDARGFPSIVIDLLFAAENQELVKYFIAHEAHHFYRNKHLTFNFKNKNSKESTLLNDLNQLQAEGIADQIDKRHLFFNGGLMENSGFAKMYKKHLANSANIITQFDSLLVLISKEDTNQIKYISKLTSILPMNGHPTGYFMANTIIEELGKDELIRDWADPYAFLKKYNRAAQMSKKDYPLISKVSMNYIKKIMMEK